MRRSLLLPVLLLLFSFAGSDKSHNNANKSARLGFVADTTEDPEIFGCILSVNPQVISKKEWREYLSKTLELDSLSVDSIPAGIYTVLVRFGIDTNGRICDVIGIKDPGYGLAERVVQIMSAYKGSWQPGERWQPGELNMRPVKEYLVQPVIFVVEDEEDECKDIRPEENIL